MAALAQASRLEAFRLLVRHEPNRLAAGEIAKSLAVPQNTMSSQRTRLSVAIYHNPSCGTSRNALAMIHQSGEEPEIIEYLKTPPNRAKLRELTRAMGISVRALLREKGTPHAELNLADPKWSDDELIDFMLAHPILINRPIVVTAKATRLCRPSEAVLNLLDNPVTSFVKEDGQKVARA